MRAFFTHAPLAALIMLGACGAPSDESEASASNAAQMPPAEPQSAAGTAELEDVKVAEFDDIEIPRVAGIDAAAAERINATLTSLRGSAATSAAECKAAAGANGFTYDLDTKTTYNADGVLSLRMTGDSFCGGANGSTLVDARTFDLQTGEEIDVVKASGMTASDLLKASAQGYSGDGNCGDFVTSNVGTDQVALQSAFVMREGIGVNYAINAGAAESCAADAGRVAWGMLADGPKLFEPLRTIANRAK